MASRRRKLAIGCGTPVLVLLLAALALYLSMTVGLKKLEPGARLPDRRAHVVADGFVAAYLLEVGDGTAVLIDAAQDKTGKAVLAALAAHHLDVAHLRAVLLTHGHPDHVGGLHVLPGVPVYALASESRLVAGTVAAKSPAGHVFGASPTGLRVTNPVHDGETLHFGDLAVDVFAVPGHTAGSAAYLARGVLYLGDSAGGCTDGTIQGAPWVFSDSVDENRASLAALAARLRPRRAEIRALAFGHQGPLDGPDGLLNFGE